MGDFGGKCILVVGGTSGIGLKTSKMISDNGGNVVIVGSDQDKLDNALHVINEKSFGIRCDLRDPFSVSDIFRISKEMGLKYSGMVYCAGISPLMPVSENDCDVMKDTFSINCLSFIECVKYFISDGMSEDNSSIVAISSIAASQSNNRQCVYASSKAALEESVRCMAKELMCRKIRVNAVALGAVRTEMFDKLEKDNPDLEKRYPLGAIPVEQVCDLVRYLLSGRSDHMTGSILKMDAGHDVWLR